MKDDSSCGVIYIASGEKYINEAINSCKSLKSKMNEDIQIIIYTNSHKQDMDIFDEVYTLNKIESSYGDSILRPDMLKYDKNLFLDTDTFVCEDITSDFKILDKYDVAAAHNPGSRSADDRPGYNAREVPRAFPQFNTGVMFLRGNQRAKELLTTWRKIYNNTKEDTQFDLNQPSFREAAYYSSAKIAVLPSEYNFRIRYRGSVNFSSEDVKIIHGRHPYGLENISKIINSYEGMRVVTPEKWPIKVKDKNPNIQYILMGLVNERKSDNSFKNRFIQSVRNRGIAKTFIKMVQ